MSCLLCGRENAYRELWSIPDRLYWSKSTFLLGCCTNCGFVYLNPMPGQEELERHYPSIYYGPPSEHNPHSFQWRHSSISRYKNVGRILDIGCSNGAFIFYLQQRGWDIYGLDNSPYAIEVAAEILGERVYLGTLLDAGYPVENFDVVSLFEVLEHLPDLKSHLEEIHRILKPDGLLCFTVPNFSSWESRIFGRWWNGLDAPRHLYQLTHETAEMLVEESGFELVEVCSVNAHHVQIGRSRIDYSQQSIRFFLRDIGLYPPMPEKPGEIVESNEQEGSLARAVLKRLFRIVEGSVLYPFWFASKLADRDNTLWVVARKR